MSGYRRDPATGEMRYHITSRDKLIYRIIHHLNERKLHGQNLHFVTEFGLLHIWWGRSGWQNAWIKTFNLPSDLETLPHDDYIIDDTDETYHIEPAPVSWEGYSIAFIRDKQENPR